MPGSSPSPDPTAADREVRPCPPPQRAGAPGAPRPRADEVPEPATAVADAATADVAPSAAGPAVPEPLGDQRPAPPRTFGLVVLLGSMAALGAINTDLYLPSLPQVADDLGATASATQLTITVVLVGMALGQVVVGPLSDRYGRRPPVVVGFAVFAVASLLCSVAPSLPLLVGLRFLQGLGVAAGAVTGMAVVRDLFTGAAAARLMSRLVLVIGVAPLFAPTVGGALAGVAGWRAVFVVLAVAGVVLLLAVRRRLPETRPDGAASPGAGRGVRHTLGQALRTYARLLRDRRFVGFALLPGLAMSVIVCYVSVSPFVLQEVHGLSTAQFSLLFAVNGVALVGGTQLNAALVGRYAPLTLLRVGVPTTAVLALVLLVVVLTGAGGLAGLLVALWFLLGSGGLISPNAVTCALAEHGRTAGSAAALVTAAQFGLGGAVGSVAGLLGGDERAMAVVMVGAALAACCSLLVAVRARPVAVAPAG
ncbi:Bcr/CflA family efflux MFS transporter [Kineococcus auxinigenes]|uniref:Bcr/CflA family efflux MFS transporter n=1 Tax=unclassified Kineococcus TaxID=2621656 RepID=UPI003D7C6709